MKKRIIFYSLLSIILLPNPVFANPNMADSNNQLKLTLLEQKLQTRIDGVFANTPTLLSTYHKIQNSELKQIQELPEYNELLNSRELKILNNSPEMQECLKEITKNVNMNASSINEQISAIDEQTKQLQKALNDHDLLENTKLSAREIREKINLNINTSNELKKQVNGAIQPLNNLTQLYFTDTKKLNSLSDLTPIQKPDTLTTDMLLVTIANLDQLIDTRIDNMLLETIGIASGDKTDERGLWVKGFKSYAKQTEYKLTPGYKLNQSGVAVGIDFIENPFIWGISYSFIADHLNTNIPNTKEKINSHIASIYSLYECTNDLFIDMQARYGRSYIRKSRNNLNLSNDVSYAKTIGNIYGGKLELNYSYNLQEKLNVIPSIGISFDELQINGYKETGTGFNRKIGKRILSKTTNILGLKLNNYIAINSYIIVPEIHAKVFQDLSTNNDETVITILDGVNALVTPSGKLPKTSYRIGGSTKITGLQALELAFGYDVNMSKKFYSHTGYVSVKVTF